MLSTVPQGHKLTLVAKGGLSQYRENYGHRIAHWDVNHKCEEEFKGISSSLPGCLSRLVPDAISVDPLFKPFDEWIVPHKEWLAQLSQLLAVCVPIGAQTTIFSYASEKKFDVVLGLEADFDLNSSSHNKIQKNLTNLSWEEVIKHALDAALSHELFGIEDFQKLVPANQELVLNALHASGVQNALTAELSKHDLQHHLSGVTAQASISKARKI